MIVLELASPDNSALDFCNSSQPHRNSFRHQHIHVTMASPATSRMVLRQSKVLFQRRAASTNAASKAGTAAKETVQNTASKAQQGLSKVTSSAGPALSKAALSVSSSLSSVGGRTGQLIGFVQGEKRRGSGWLASAQ